jgi:pilus assembly protein Flp/PilA
MTAAPATAAPCISYNTLHIGANVGATEETGPMNHLSAVRKFFARFVTRREGATVAEYGLLLALFAVVCIAAMASLGTRISSVFQSLSTSL